uniref:DNA methylase N-4/N-6 domain-containing protein n=1 Tax=viral metagenome TaxID=1070528 RepID=A0A6C0BJC1_9ZZZZ
MFLTLADYLALFPSIKLSKNEFQQRFVITYADHPTLQDLFAFRSVIKNPEDPRYQQRDQIVDYFYDVIITNRHQYLTDFYRSYFELPDVYQLKWDGVDILTPAPGPGPIVTDSFNSVWLNYLSEPEQYQDQMLMQLTTLIKGERPLNGLSLQKNDLSRKVIRNLNYLDILHRTRVTNTCKSRTSFWQTLINVYNQLQLEDRFFAPSSIGLFLRPKSSGGINYNNFFYLFQQYQPKASILNPYTMNWVLKHVFSGTRLFTPVLSWASYLCAFMHSDWEEYVGVDVMSSVCQRCQFLFDHYQQELKPRLRSQGNHKEVARLDRKSLQLYCQPSESLLYDTKFLNQYQNYFDAILICPPYFDMEIYPEGDQSINCYPNYQDWLSNYWEDTVALCYLVLKPQHRFGMIVNNYVSLKKEEYPLIADLNLIALKYFKLVNVFQLLNRVSPLRMNKKNRTEMLFIYEKL